MEIKQFGEIELKSITEGDGNTIEGYGSIFGNVDRGGDVVQAGAFAKSLSSGRKVKMLWQHDSREVIGVWDEISEDAKGLKVKGRLLNTPRAHEARELIKAGAIEGLSIGYATIDSEYNQSNDIRIIKEAELWEISVVTFPMNEAANIDAIKAAEIKRNLERAVKESGSYSRSETQEFIKAGKAAVDAMRDAATIDETKDNEVIEAEKMDAELFELLNRRIDITR